MLASRQKSASEQAVAVRSLPRADGEGRIVVSNKQQDKLKSWIHIVKKKTARLSTRITASLGLISLTRDDEFERHHESFKQLERTIRIFIKNITAFVEHYESFLLALQNTSDNLSDFYRDKPLNQRELAEMKRKNKALQCEHFHAFKRTVERQVIAVSSQLLQKFSGPHQLIKKRSAKLLDFDTKAKELESCKDSEKKVALNEQYVIAKDLYDRINGILIHELPLFNQFALDIFRQCILVLLESRRNLIMSYTSQTASLLETPSMASYTASDVASSILMSCKEQPIRSSQQLEADGRSSGFGHNTVGPGSDIRSLLNDNNMLAKNRQASGSTQPSCSSGGDPMYSDDTSASRPHSALSHLGFEQVNEMVGREISSTPLSSISKSGVDEYDAARPVDENDRHHNEHEISRISSNGSSDNQHNENIEAAARLEQPFERDPTPAPNQDIESQQTTADDDSDDDVYIDDNNDAIEELRNHLDENGGEQILKSERKKKNGHNKQKYPIYVALWPFIATDQNQLTISCHQRLKLIKDTDECGNADWSYVKDRRGNMGYVPSSYIQRRGSRNQ